MEFQPQMQPSMLVFVEKKNPTTTTSSKHHRVNTATHTNTPRAHLPWKQPHVPGACSRFNGLSQSEHELKAANCGAE